MLAQAGLSPFPVRTGACVAPPALRVRGLSLRHAHAGDLDALAALYADTRREELSPIPWSEAAKDAFLADQFAMQHHHFLAHYGNTDFMVIQGDAQPVGRYYLQHGEHDDLIVDISLLQAWRGQGVGSALIAASQVAAAQAGRGVKLSVMAGNQAARQLYERLGFVATSQDGMHQSMAWRPRGTPGIS